ncbi:hypothetical protein K490DRAFT_76722 [Saccharata proteae CBS 121410]|uniref:Pleckstrin homology domain-containing protein n=1 Tax=Saccharata proteae CBS 121410 TaxID=1314787 RepID=A0A9P4HMF1_9PEZI|nr:hypothetical protein K490DRAFT_76722 [Saccharata proteae CBS 121410]
MATDYLSDHESFMSAPALPTPADTPYQTPRPSGSRVVSQHGTPMSVSDTASPPPLLPDSKNSDPATDNSISILDPRRFTPTLHANLVAEILSLRRDLDSKNRLVEHLETSLQSSKLENENLSQELNKTSKDHRSAKRQIEQLETGTLSALESLVQERDQIKAANLDLKAKLDEYESKARSREDETNRTQNLWDTDKLNWDADKRSLERRIHVTESRLKTVLEELAAEHAAAVDHVTESEGEDFKDSGFGNESDSASNYSRPSSACRGTPIKSRHRRNMSSASMRSISPTKSTHRRNQSSNSIPSIGHGYKGSISSLSGADARRLGLQSLADELAFDEEEEELDELELDSDDCIEGEMRARRMMESRLSHHDQKAKKILGLANAIKISPMDSSDRDANASIDTATLAETATLNANDTLSGSPKRKGSRPEYVDAGIQFSPPSSPSFAPEALQAAKNNGHIIGAMDVEANQRKKRVSMPFMDNPVPNALEKRRSGLMVSTSSQTPDQPMSPPETPVEVWPASPETPTTPAAEPAVASTSTQTETPEVEKAETRLAIPPSPSRAAPPPPISIPQIAIIPPRSTPSSPKSARLPPGTKSASCQTEPEPKVVMRTTSMQTEPIRLDKRIFNKLPPHLLPSAISSKPSTPEKAPVHEKPVAQPVLATPFQEKGKTPLLPSTQELLKQMRSASSHPTEDRYPGNNDNGPLRQDGREGPRRPFRTSSLFAGFEGRGSDDERPADEEDSSDDDSTNTHVHAQVAQGRAVKYIRPFANPPTPVPEEKEVGSKVRGPSPRSSIDVPARVEKPVRMGSFRKQPSVRRSAMVSSGVSAHEQRSRSPSLGSLDSQKPPFPVPTRFSSRRVPLSKSEGSGSPTPRGPNMFAGRRAQPKQHNRQDSLRKVRSAAVIPRAGRQRSRSPPLPSSSREEAKVPPMPKDRVAGPQPVGPPQRNGHVRQPSTNTQYTGSQSVGSSVQSVSVVDAIAATMVGEWMWKYVRGRRSFGVADAVSPEFGRDDGTGNGSNGIRHKRWVWLSPYERSVMWSSKQPISGSALLGKTGRKLPIQSVLDVKDDTPMPKGVGAQPIFNRSIIILTPQRALKFTATSAERHYLWLTSLSFLAHSSQAIPDLNNHPPAPPMEAEVTQNPPVALGRAPINNSIRLAKNKHLQRGYPTRATEPIYEHGIPDDLEKQYHNNKLAAATQPLLDGASPPLVPRIHQRKRSMTQPYPPPPPNAYRTYPHQHMPSTQTYSSNHSSSSNNTNVTINDAVINNPPSVPSSVYNPPSSLASRRTSEATEARDRNFFDAVGTVRMEAFVEPLLKDEAAPPVPRRHQGRGRRGSQWSSRTTNASGGSDVFGGF